MSAGRERLIDDEDPRVRLRAAQQILERALGKANLPIEIAAVDHERALAEAREALARRLEDIRERRAAGPSPPRRGVALRDVLDVAREAGLLDKPTS